MTFSELAPAMFPTLAEDAMKRLVEDDSLFDPNTHKLRDGMTSGHARATLMLSHRLASECGMKLVLSFSRTKAFRKESRTLTETCQHMAISIFFGRASKSFVFLRFCFDFLRSPFFSNSNASLFSHAKTRGIEWQRKS